MTYKSVFSDAEVYKNTPQCYEGKYVGCCHMAGQRRVTVDKKLQQQTKQSIMLGSELFLWEIGFSAY